MYTFITLLGIFTVVLFFCMYRTHRSKKPISTVMMQLMVSVLFPVAGNIIIVFSETEWVSGLGYAIYFASTDWMLAYMIRFVAEYCDYNYRKTGIERIVGFLAGVDTVLVLLNPILHHCIGLDRIVLDNGHIYYKYYSLWYHYVHLGFSYVITSVCVILLLVKIAKTSALYREKYLVILFSVIVIAVWEMYYIVNKSVMEYSMVGYLTMAILIYFFAIEYKPYIATYKMFNEVVSNISEAIFFFDENNKCIYMNRQANQIYNMEKQHPQGVSDATNAWEYAMSVLTGGEFDMDDMLNEGFFQCVRDFIVGDEKYTYDIEYQRVTDKSGHTAGAFITAKDRTEEQRRLDKERYQATHDSLTGLYNADYLYSRIEKRLIETPDQRYVVVTSDIKGFKMVNDIYGTKTGDEILINIARQIEAKSSEGTIYGRLGNDKFGLMMKRENYREEIFSEDVQRITHLDEDMFYPIIVHVGVYEITDRRIPVSVMFDRAFMALSTIKNDMQKRVAYYDSNLREDMLWEQRIAGSIEEGLEKEQIIPYMQPQVTTEGVIQGVELLARWMHPTEGFLKPRRFLSTLEKNGFVVRLDQFMWERACRTIKRWEKMGWNDLYISVNISPVDFFFIDVVETLKDLVNKYDVDPKKLRLEITETTMMHDAKRRIEVIDRLREVGFIVEMDDFGNGFSSLNMLKDIPIDVMKIDMTFLDETRDISRANEILESIIALAKKLEIPVIIEGVETLEQVRALADMGCNMFQGYYYARAVPIDEFEDRYIKADGGRIVRDI